jgi:hypothetical protein
MEGTRQQATEGLQITGGEGVATLESENAGLRSALAQSKADYNGIMSGKGLSEIDQMCASIASWIHDEEKSSGASIGVDSECKEDGDRNILLKMLHYNV